MYQLRKQKHPIVAATSGNPVVDMLTYARNNSLIVSIELFKSSFDDLRGYVSDITADMIIIEQIADDGEKDGDSVVSLSNITCVICDSDREMSIKLLAENISMTY